jgi:DivIVA domain-containing protein
MAWEFKTAMRGYSRREVDELFARITANEATPAEILAARFHKQTRGYAPAEVDAALAEIRDKL